MLKHVIPPTSCCKIIIQGLYKCCVISVVHFRILRQIKSSGCVLILRRAGLCVRASADLPGCLASVTRCLQLAAAAGGPSAQTESAGELRALLQRKRQVLPCASFVLSVVRRLLMCVRLHSHVVLVAANL